MKHEKAFYFILFIFCVALFNSCYTEKKAVKQTQKAVLKYPDTTRGIFRTRWPLVIVNTPTDSIEFKKYISEIELISQMLEEERNKFPIIDTFPLFVEDEQKILILQKNIAIERDKLNKLSVSYLKLKKLCKERPPLRDTIKIEDSSAIDQAYYITGQIVNAKEKELKDAIQGRDDAKKKLKNRNKLILILSICLGIFLIPLLIKLILKLKK